MQMNVSSIDPFSSTAYPDKSAAVVYLAGCSLKCPWCWSHEMLDPITGQEKEVTQIIQEINQDPSEVEAVVVDGGEPTEQSEALVDLVSGLKECGYLIQINTNGANPDMIEELGIRGFIDRLGIDIKAPLDYQRLYSKVIGREVLEEHLENLRRLLRASSVCKYQEEPRTTIVPDLMDKGHWIEQIAKEISLYTDTYVLQGFTPEKGTLKPEFKEKEPLKREQLVELGKRAKKHLKDVRIRIPGMGTEKI